MIGVGLNLSIAPEEFPAELRETAISLGAASRELAGAAEPDATRPQLDCRTSAAGSRQSDEAILAAWRERDALRGREISWDGGSGVADGVDERGDLLVVTAGGDRVVLGAGEVHLRL